MKNKQNGVALVEFALILPLLLLLTFITTEFGRAVYQYNTITKSVRDAVRYLSTQTPGTQIPPSQKLDCVWQYCRHGTASCSGS